MVVAPAACFATLVSDSWTTRVHRQVKAWRKRSSNAALHQLHANAGSSSDLDQVGLCNPHNPVGLVHRREDLVALAELADKYGVYVLSDEIHAPLVLPGADFVPFLSVSDEARRWGFSFLSASKGWNLAGLKAASVVTADKAPKRYVDRISPHSLYRTGHLGVIATVAAFNDGDQWLADFIELLDHNRRLLDDLLTKLLPQFTTDNPKPAFSPGSTSAFSTGTTTQPNTSSAPRGSP